MKTCTGPVGRPSTFLVQVTACPSQVKPLYTAGAAPQLYLNYCQGVGAATIVNGSAPCSSSKRFAQNPVTGAIVSQAFAGTVVPAAQGGTGSIIDGSCTSGPADPNLNVTVPDCGLGLRAGQYDTLRPISFGPRVAPGAAVGHALRPTVLYYEGGVGEECRTQPTR